MNIRRVKGTSPVYSMILLETLPTKSISTVSSTVLFRMGVISFTNDPHTFYQYNDCLTTKCVSVSKTVSGSLCSPRSDDQGPSKVPKRESVVMSVM